MVQLDYQQNPITNQPSLQFENNEFVVGLGDELNAELKTTVQICDGISVLKKILQIFVYFKYHNSQ